MFFFYALVNVTAAERSRVAFLNGDQDVSAVISLATFHHVMNGCTHQTRGHRENCRVDMVDLQERLPIEIFAVDEEKMHR